MIKLLLTISNLAISQPICEAAVTQALGFPEAAVICREGSGTIPAAKLTVPAGWPTTGNIGVTVTREVAGYIGAGVETGTLWTVTLTNGSWPEGWLDDYVAARWVLAGGVRSVEMAPWTARLDPRAMPRPSLALKPAASNPYGLSVHLLQ